MCDRIKIRSLKRRLNEFNCSGDIPDIELEANALKGIFITHMW